MKPKEKAQEIGKEILAVGQSNKGRWMLAAMFVAGLLVGLLSRLVW